MFGKRSYRRLLSALMAVTMVVCNIFMYPTASYASNRQAYNFEIDGDAFLSAIEELTEGPAKPVAEEDFEFTDGDREAVESVLLRTERNLAWYECDPVYEFEYEEAAVRTFVRLPDDLENGISLNEQIKVAFLYENRCEEEISCSVTVRTGDGDRRTAPVVLKAYENAFEEEQEVASGSNASGVLRTSGTRLVGIDGWKTGKLSVDTLESLNLPGGEQELLEDGLTFQMEDLMDEKYPVLTYSDGDGNVLSTVVNDGVVTLPGGEGLPRDVQIGFQLAYSLKNSEDPSVQDYAVCQGDRFVYELPDLFDYPETFPIKSNEGQETIGMASVSGEGQLVITITKSGIGKDFRGNVYFYSAVDWSKVDDTVTELVFTVDGKEYRIKLQSESEEALYSVKIKKSTGAEDLRYSEETGLVTGIRFHVLVTADEDNAGPLTGLAIKDEAVGNSKLWDYISFDRSDDPSFRVSLESNNMEADPENQVADLCFLEPGSDGNVGDIQLRKESGEAAALLPGQEIQFSYWMDIDQKLWSEFPLEKTEGQSLSVSSGMEFQNHVSVISAEGAQDKHILFVKNNYNWFTKSGTAVDRETVDGQDGVAVEYHVFVNPDLLDMGGWVIKDILDKKQSYLGDVTIKAYEHAYATQEEPVWEESFTPSGEQEGNADSWTYRIPDQDDQKPGTVFLDILYYTTPNNAADSNLSNEIRLFAKGENDGPIGQGILSILYNTFSLDKKNLVSSMSGSSFKEPVDFKPGTIGWDLESGFGVIPWESTLYSHANGGTARGSIPAGSVYTDQLSVEGRYGGAAGVFADKQSYHIFESLDGGTWEDSLSLTDGSGAAVHDYNVTLSDDHRSFTIELLKDVTAPVQIRYTSLVTDFTVFDNEDTRFVNTAVLKIGEDAVWSKQASQPFSRQDYLDKKAVSVENGKVTWELNYNAGYGKRASFELSDATVDIIERLPKGLRLESIRWKGNVLLENRDYEARDGAYVIHLNRLFEKNPEAMNANQTFLVITAIENPQIMEFVNSAQLTIDGKLLGTAKAVADVGAQYLVKGMVYNGVTAPSARYTLDINELGADISNLEDGTLAVQDRLESDQMSYLVDSFRITDVASGADISDVKRRINDREFTIEGIPDERHIRITYDVMIHGEIGSRVETGNSAKLIYGINKSVTSSVNTAVTVVTPGGTGTGTPSVLVYKVDQAGQALEGAEFGLYLAEYRDGAWKKGELLGTYLPVVTDGKNAAVEISALGDGSVLKRGTAYYLEEIKAPEGYQRSEEGRFFAIQGGPEGTLKDIDIVPSGTNLTFSNRRLEGALTIQKTVTGKEREPNYRNVFYFTVFDGTDYYDRQGKPSGYKTVVELDYDSSRQENTVTLEGLPVGVYTVEETADRSGTPVGSGSFYYHVTANGKDASSADVTVNESAGVTVSFVNRYDAQGDLVLVAKKSLTGRAQEAGEFRFLVLEDGRQVAAGKNESDGTVRFTPIAYRTVDVGSHTYTVLEETGSQPGVSYDRETYSVTVRVTDLGDGRIDISVVEIRRSDHSAADSILFHNTYSGGSGGGNTGGGGGNTGGGSGGQSSSASSGGTVTVNPEPVPLANLPENGPGSGVDLWERILDEDVPLAGLPKTGESSAANFFLLLMSAVAGIVIFKRKEE